MKLLQQSPRKAQGIRKGQSLVEFALGSVLIVMLLAAAVDLGRAFYTYVVVLNMSGEAATILAFYPDSDINQDISTGRFTPDDQTFQRRAEQVAARSMGLVISSDNISDSDVTVTASNGGPMDACLRYAGTPFDIHVTYHLDDLFLPSLLGFRHLPIGGTSGSRFTTPSNQIDNCN